MTRALASVGCALAIGVGAASAKVSEVHFVRLLQLSPGEGVFAYARISPDGRLLAYASELPPSSTSGAPAQTEVVVDLGTKRPVFTESGIDAYWSDDGRRMIYLSLQGLPTVAIRHRDTGEVVRGVAPANLGDYFSWAKRDGRDLILTIQSNYFYLDGDKGVLPASRVPACPGIGVGDRPLISKDGRRISTFVRGALVIRDLTDCADILDTGIQGAKADFSWDGRYVAFHAPKADLSGYEIEVVDTQRRTVRTVTNLPGSSLFPSWTRDGRLCFRYDGDDYRGFMMADHVLSAPERPLPSGGPKVPATVRWSDLFPETPRPAQRVVLVMIWAPWSAHAPAALADLQRAGRNFIDAGVGVAVATALELGSMPSDVERMRAASAITLPELPLARIRVKLTEALNQIPTTLLFRDGVQVDRRLGAQTYEGLLAWVNGALPGAALPLTSGSDRAQLRR